MYIVIVSKKLSAASAWPQEGEIGIITQLNIMSENSTTTHPDSTGTSQALVADIRQTDFPGWQLVKLLYFLYKLYY